MQARGGCETFEYSRQIVCVRETVSNEENRHAPCGSSFCGNKQDREQAKARDAQHALTRCNYRAEFYFLTSYFHFPNAFRCRTAIRLSKFARWQHRHPTVRSALPSTEFSAPRCNDRAQASA